MMFKKKPKRSIEDYGKDYKLNSSPKIVNHNIGMEAKINRKKKREGD